MQCIPTAVIIMIINHHNHGHHYYHHHDCHHHGHHYHDHDDHQVCNCPTPSQCHRCATPWSCPYCHCARFLGENHLSSWLHAPSITSFAIHPSHNIKHQILSHGFDQVICYITCKLQYTHFGLQVRYHRMRGCETVWVPGSDHAGIATQVFHLIVWSHFALKLLLIIVIITTSRWLLRRNYWQAKVWAGINWGGGSS